MINFIMALASDTQRKGDNASSFRSPVTNKQGAALTGRNTTGPPRAAPAELRCICAALQTTTTYTADRY